MDRVAQAVRARPGLVLGHQIMDPAQMDRCRELGARMIILSQDTGILYSAYQDGLLALKKGL